MNRLGLYFPNNCSFSIASLGIFPIPLLQYSRTLHWVVLTTGGRKVLLEVRSRFQWQPFAGFLFSWKNQPHKDLLFGNPWAACAKLWGWTCAGGMGDYVNFLSCYSSRSPCIMKIQPKLSAAVVLLYLNVYKSRFCSFKIKIMDLELN